MDFVMWFWWYFGFWSTRILPYFPISSSVCHRRDISTFLDYLMVSTMKTIYFLKAHHLGRSSWLHWPPGSPESPGPLRLLGPSGSPEPPGTPGPPGSPGPTRSLVFHFPFSDHLNHIFSECIHLGWSSWPYGLVWESEHHETFVFHICTLLLLEAWIPIHSIAIIAFKAAQIVF